MLNGLHHFQKVFFVHVHFVSKHLTIRYIVQQGFSFLCYPLEVSVVHPTDF